MLIVAKVYGVYGNTQHVVGLTPVPTKPTTGRRNPILEENNGLVYMKPSHCLPWYSLQLF